MGGGGENRKGKIENRKKGLGSRWKEGGLVDAVDGEDLGLVFLTVDEAVRGLEGAEVHGGGEISLVRFKMSGPFVTVRGLEDGGFFELFMPGKGVLRGRAVVGEQEDADAKGFGGDGGGVARVHVVDDEAGGVEALGVIFDEAGEFVGVIAWGRAVGGEDAEGGGGLALANDEPTVLRDGDFVVGFERDGFAIEEDFVGVGGEENVGREGSFRSRCELGIQRCGAEVQEGKDDGFVLHNGGGVFEVGGFFMAGAVENFVIAIGIVELIGFDADVGEGVICGQ